ncbi:hypothetical protein L6452_30983 [Arctium lappa]|uniref:Uncharacterized protein n=1 Tax=Arctium lappa TaxID=4217 RepID=A0ACB8ZJW4_ARCLA|nr:hypothetical protein L6452_30983 [Arctium lappa]
MTASSRFGSWSDLDFYLTSTELLSIEDAKIYVDLGTSSIKGKNKGPNTLISTGSGYAWLQLKTILSEIQGTYLARSSPCARRQLRFPEPI